MIPPARLFFLLAREAPTAVVFRRGPSKEVRIVRWNREDDTFEPGHWLRGRIYERRSDLSPDGRLLVYFAMGGDGRTYTAISRPPYLTALALWFATGAWSGGGLFEDDGSLALNDGGLPFTYDEGRAAPPIRIDRLRVLRGEDSPIDEARMQRDGWTLVETLDATIPKMPDMPELRDDLDALKDWLAAVDTSGFSGGYTTHRAQRMERRFGDHVLVETLTLDRFERTRRYEVAGIDLAGVAQADWDTPRARLVFAREGKIFAWTPAGGPARELFDTTPQTFEAFPPPDWARSWPT